MLQTNIKPDKGKDGHGEKYRKTDKKIQQTDKQIMRQKDKQTKETNRKMYKQKDG